MVDNSNIATLASTIRAGVTNRLKDVHTAMPGIIESFDAVAQTVKVKPAIRRVFITREAEKNILAPADLPVLINVPIYFPSGGGFDLTFPIIPGDECLLVFSERAIDGWHTFGDVRAPTARRFHDLSDAIAYVGIKSKPNKISSYSTSATQLRNKAGSQFVSLEDSGDINIEAPGNIMAKAGGNIDAEAAGSATIKASSAKIDVPTTTVTGALIVQGLLTYSNGLAGSPGSNGSSLSGDLEITTGDIIADGISLKGHGHSQDNDSAGNAQVDTNEAKII